MRPSALMSKNLEGNQRTVPHIVEPCVPCIHRFKHFFLFYFFLQASFFRKQQRKQIEIWSLFSPDLWAFYWQAPHSSVQLQSVNWTPPTALCICICTSISPRLVSACYFYLVFNFLLSLSITIPSLFIPLVHCLSTFVLCSLPSNQFVVLCRTVWQNDIYAV